MSQVPEIFELYGMADTYTSNLSCIAANAGTGAFPAYLAVSKMREIAMPQYVHIL